MKSFKLISAALVLGAFMLSGCQEKEVFGIDPSKPAPQSVTLDADNSSATVLAVLWDPRDAVNAGATSFTVQANESVEGGGDNYDNTVAKTLLVTDEIFDAAIFNGLKAGVSYCIRVRANYPRSKYSEWVYLSENGSPKMFTISLAVPTFKVSAAAELATISWNSVSFATGYVVEYKKSSDSKWESIVLDKVTSCEISGLQPETQYDFRMKATMKDGAVSSELSAVQTVTTLFKPPFPLEISTSAEFVTKFNDGSIAAAGAGDEIILMGDIDLSGATLEPLELFMGVFNGNNHALKNLSGTKPLIIDNKGTVKDLVIDASCMFTPAVETFGVVAQKNSGVISNVINKAKVEYSVETAATSIIMAGIAGESTGEIKDSKNTGNISLTASDALYGAAVAGIAGYAVGTLTNNVNEGSVTVTTPYVISKSTPIALYSKVLPCMGGIAAFLGNASTVKNCDNSGKIEFNMTAVDRTTIAVERFMFGGLFGNAEVSLIEDSDNSGEVVIKAKKASPDNEPYSSFNVCICVGGICGGDYYGDQKASTIKNCVNSGNITFDSDCSGNNSTCGGIVGWPGVEGAQSGVVENSKNTGNINIKGHVYGRFGGVMGGTGHLIGASNTGTITVDAGISAKSAVASVNAFHSQGHTIKDCVAGGKVVVNVDVSGGVGALIGNQGNAQTISGEGCQINCDITVMETEAECGLVVGKFNGTSKVVTLGTPESPIRILGGAINGKEITGANDRIVGSGYSAAVHTIVTAFGK